MRLQHKTGRVYDGAQVLQIDVPPTPGDLFADVRIAFSDPSRHISGVVTLMACQIEFGVGAAVLREYDAGRYETN